MEPENTLQELRKEIDSIDLEMLKLFNRRMCIAEHIAAVKQTLGLPVTDGKREAEVLEFAGKMADEGGEESARAFMQKLIELSKRRQESYLTNIQDVADNQNIIFIGMPGCGKTTVSRLVADRLCKEWFDSDLIIEKDEGRKIAEIFISKGESYFRERETACLQGLCKKRASVIAAGGGAVVWNYHLIKNSGLVIYLQRSVESIVSTLQTENRPLLSDRESLIELFAQRHELYENCCDITISNEGNIEKTVDMVLEIIKQS